MRFSTSPVLLVALVAGTLSVVTVSAIPQSSTAPYDSSSNLNKQIKRMNSPFQNSVSHGTGPTQEERRRDQMVDKLMKANQSVVGLSHDAYGRIWHGVIKDKDAGFAASLIHGHRDMRVVVDFIKRLKDNDPARRALENGEIVRLDNELRFYVVRGGKVVFLSS
ncbi:hypothetical protein BC835DRAFT_1325542, partial [Cytidiella melzeri]